MSKLSDRQKLVDRMARAIWETECEENPGYSYPTWGTLSEWARVTYQNRAEMALRVVQRQFNLQF